MRRFARVIPEITGENIYKEYHRIFSLSRAERINRVLRGAIHRRAGVIDRNISLRPSSNSAPNPKYDSAAFTAQRPKWIFVAVPRNENRCRRPASRTKSFRAAASATRAIDQGETRQLRGQDPRTAEVLKRPSKKTSRGSPCIVSRVSCVSLCFLLFRLTFSIAGNIRAASKWSCE